PPVGALSLHGALPIFGIVAASALFNLCAYLGAARHRRRHAPACPADEEERAPGRARAGAFAVECAVTALLGLVAPLAARRPRARSEEHTSGLQSPCQL